LKDSEGRVEWFSNELRRLNGVIAVINGEHELERDKVDKSHAESIRMLHDSHERAMELQAREFKKRQEEITKRHQMYRDQVEEDHEDDIREAVEEALSPYTSPKSGPKSEFGVLKAAVPELESVKALKGFNTEVELIEDYSHLDLDLDLELEPI